MPDYRVYLVDNHILAAAYIVTCDTDQEAMEKARPLVNGQDVELWQGGRQVGRVKTDEALHRSHSFEDAAAACGGKACKPSSFGIGAEPWHHEHCSPSTSVPTEASG